MVGKSLAHRKWLEKAGYKLLLKKDGIHKNMTEMKSGTLKKMVEKR